MKGGRVEGGPQAERSRRIETQGYLQEHLPSTNVPDRHVSTKTGSASAAGIEFATTALLKQQESRSATAAVAACADGCCVESARLGDERDFLRKYVERLLGQLRELLQRYGELDRLKALADPNNSVAGDAEDLLEHMAPWLTSSEYTNPLFQAYDLKIQELEASMTENKKALDRVVMRAEGLANENTTLRQELETAGEKMLLRMQHEPKGALGDDLLSMPPMDTDSGEYLGEINERIDVLMAENSMLMEQVSLQDDELGAMKKDLADRDAQLQVMAQNFNEATLTLQELRDACTQLREEKTHCERQLQRYAASIAQLESAKEALEGKVDDAKGEYTQLETKLQEYETLLQNVKKGAERKDERFSERYQNVCVRLRELTDALQEKDKAVDELQEQKTALQTELDAVRQDCEGMLNVLTSMEKQLTQYCAREDAVAELEEECKTKVEEAILEKEEVVAREQQSRREIARLLERLHHQAEAHVKTQNEGLSASERKHENELNVREQEIRALSAELVQLRAKVDTTTRNQKEADRKLADALRRAKDSSGAFEKKLQQLTERAASAEEARDMASHVEAEYLERIRAKEDALTKLRGEFRDRGQELNERVSSLERELEMRRTEAREAKDESEEQHRKVQMLSEQLNKVKADCAGRFTTEFELLHQQNRDVKAQAAELEYRLGQTKKEAATALETARNERERGEVRLIAEVESLKARVQTLKDERKRADARSQETDARCSVLGLKVQQLTRDLSDAKELLLEQEHACEDSDRKVSELSSQLTAALSKQQQLYRQERELRTALERLTLEKTRMERETVLSRKKLEEYRADSYAFLSHSHSRDSTRERDLDRKELYAARSTREGSSGKLHPAEKTDVRYQMSS